MPFLFIDDHVERELRRQWAASLAGSLAARESHHHCQHAHPAGTPAAADAPHPESVSAAMDRLRLRLKNDTPLANDLRAVLAHVEYLESQLLAPPTKVVLQEFCPPPVADQSPPPEVMRAAAALRARAYTAINGERAYQARKWGARGHEVGGWLTLMRTLLSEAERDWTNSAGDAAALHALRKLLAVGVACAEQHGLPERQSC